MYQFLWIQEITREMYLFIDMAEYDILRGQDLKTFSQKLEKVFAFELRGKYSVKEERLNYQRRKSKRNNKDNWFSCSKEYNQLIKYLQELGCHKDEIPQILEILV